MDRASDSSASSTIARERAGKYLTFFLAGEEYGLEIRKVHEIIGIMPITRVPRTPAFIRGVINLRGKVIAIMDLRARFGLQAAAQEASACIIVVRLGGVQMGVLADSVSEVLDIAEQDIEDAASSSAGIETRYLVGIAKANGRMKLLLHIDRVLAQPWQADGAVQPRGEAGRGESAE